MSFRGSLFFTLAGYCLVISLLFVIMPARGQMLCWQDGVVLCLLAYPMVSGLSTMFQDIYRSPHEAIPLPSLRPLGQLMLMPLAATAYLSFRGLKRVGFRFAVSREDFVTGVRNFLLFLPIGMPLALVIGFAHWDAKPLTGWYPLELAGNSLAFYMTVGLSEELYFRGILQNLTAESLRKPLAARLVVSVLFGFAHISRGFPNWPYVAVAATMGWFCGRAYSQSYSVVASSVTHTLVVVVQRFFFPRI